MSKTNLNDVNFHTIMSVLPYSGDQKLSNRKVNWDRKLDIDPSQQSLSFVNSSSSCLIWDATSWEDGPGVGCVCGGACEFSGSWGVDIVFKATNNRILGIGLGLGACSRIRMS